MKKVLLASTALVLGAGVAAADVTVSGDGRMGFVYDEDGYTNVNTNEDQDYRFESRIRIEFTATGETDGGLAFGGNVRADQYEDDQGTLGEEGSVFIAGEFGQLSMGDVDGGAEAVIGDLAFSSMSDLGDLNEVTYLFGDTPQALYQYANGGLTLALGVTDDEEFSAGVGFDGGMWSVGLGYERVANGYELGSLEEFGDDSDLRFSDDGQQLMASASVTFANVTLKGLYGRTEGEVAEGVNDFDVDGDPDGVAFVPGTGGDFVMNQYGVSADATFDATTVTAYYRTLELDDDFDGQWEVYGLGAMYDLGGGAALAAGVQRIEPEEGDEITQADFGLRFAF